MDPDRPDRTAVDEFINLQTGDRTAPLVKRGSASTFRVGVSWRGEEIGVGVRAVRDSCHVRGGSGRGDAREGGEFAGGGHVWNEFEWEGEYSNFGEGIGGQKRKYKREGRGRKEEVRRVYGNEEGKERKEVESRRENGYVVCGIWSIYIFLPLVIYFMEIKKIK